MKKEIIVDVTIGIMLTLYLIIVGTIIAVSKNKEVIQYYSYNAENIKNSYIENTESEYYINNAQDLWEFANKVNNGNTFEGITVYLTTDINLECNQNKQWIPIGACYVEGGNNADDTKEKDPFAGTFEGNDYSISGLYIDSESNYVGLFGYNQGTIQNLKLWYILKV